MIKESEKGFEVKAQKYQLFLDKESLLAVLKDDQDRVYTSFPIFAELMPPVPQPAKPAISWEVEGEKLRMTLSDPATSQVLLAAVLLFEAEDFEVRFGCRPQLRERIPEPPFRVRQDWGSLGVDLSVERNKISIGNKTYKKGLGTHANSEIEFKLEEDYQLFECQVGIDKEVKGRGSAVFQVWIDEQKIFDSGVVLGLDPAKPVKLPLEGAKRLKLLVRATGDSINYDHADWADAKLINPNGKVTYLSDLVTFTPEGVRCFSLGDRGFERGGWGKLFTPQPDRYYTDTPGVDVRNNQDGEWFFAPAPLNLSFQTPAGWFSVGACQIPDATSFAFRSGGIEINYPWNKLPSPPDQLYWITPLVFTFNRSEWEAIGDYHSYLLRHGYITESPIEQKETPGWWKWPLICTWGEQLIQGVGGAKPGFNTDWVKEYVLKQESRLGISNFTLILDDKWQRFYGDPKPDQRFKDLRELIEWCHQRGHRVLLWWRSWKAEEGSLAQEMGLADDGFVDATNPGFVPYVRECMKIMLREFDADGFKVDYMFDVREPSWAEYADPSLGVGMRELFRYMKVIYEEAKRVKPDCLITGSGPDPHFAEVQDMIRINDAWDGRLTREKRARISSLACPNLPMDGDAAAMYAKIAEYHYITSSVYSTPAIYYESEFHDRPISEELQRLIGKIVGLSAKKEFGRPQFLDYGHWRMVRGGVVTAECIKDGTVFSVYPLSKRGLLISTVDQEVFLPLHGRRVSEVKEGSQPVGFSVKGDRLRIGRVKRGVVYEVDFR